MNAKLMTSAFLFTLAALLTGADWPGFRGADGSGISSEANVPLTWSESKNIKWKKELPGPGSSSPIVSGKYVFVTAYSGYGVSRRSVGSQEDLVRHLLCMDRVTGKTVWTKSVKAALPEDSYRGYLTEHGYASHTPVTDGERVYAFFGKTGVLAFDFAGKELWRKDVGKQSANRRWGSAASPVLHGDLLIVNASEESRSIYAFNKKTGKQVWKMTDSDLELTYGTPSIIDVKGKGKELAIAVPYGVWGLDPDTGKRKWRAKSDLDGNISPSVVAKDGIVYAFGGYRRTGSLAVRAGGTGDVTDTHVLWSGRNGSYVPSPVILEEKLYWVSDLGYACCANAKTGEYIYKERLPIARRGKPFYASAVLAAGRLYAVSRTNGTFVLAAEPSFKQLAHNKIAGDESDFNPSPAFAYGRIYLRSNRFLYCIGED